MQITVETLLRIARRQPRESVPPWAAAISQATDAHGIDGARYLAAFIAVISDDSGRVTSAPDEVMMRVGADRLARLFPLAFPTLRVAREYENSAEAIANRVYAGINGNGDEASGDGWRYRARGLFPVLGRSAYRELGEAVGSDLEQHPQTLEVPMLAAKAAAMKWATVKGNEYVDRRDFNGLTRALRGDLEGQGVRHAVWLAACDVLGVPIVETYPKSGPQQP